jgi:hypothetical protein
VFGLLFGYYNGTGLSVCESTEALYDYTNSEVVPMLDEIEKRSNCVDCGLHKLPTRF